MEVVLKRINYKYGDEFELRPVYDVHYGINTCDVRAFKAFLGEPNPKRQFLFGGDLLDSIIVTDPRYQKSMDSTKGEAIIDEQVDTMVEILEPYAPQILGIGEGNHEQTITKRCSTNPTKRLCEKLGVDYLGLSGLMQIRFREANGRGRTLVIRYHHGWGGGARTAGASVTKYEKDMKYWDADIFIYGHDHQRKIDNNDRLGLKGNKLISRPQWLGVCGSFMKTFVEGAISYSEIKGYFPTSVGGIQFRVKPDKHWLTIKGETV